MGVDIIAIRRNHDWILNPKETETVFQGDILITRGAPSGIEEFKDLAEGKLSNTWTLKNELSLRKLFQGSWSLKILLS